MKSSIFKVTFLIIILYIFKYEGTFAQQNCTDPPKDSCCNFLDISLESVLNLTDNEDFRFNTPQLLTKYNIKFETHNVTTSEGNVLTIFRTPTLANLISNGPVVLITGLFASSEDWFAKDLATGDTIVQVLLRDGWDVWILNPRGTQFSRNNTHANLNANYTIDPYWAFSWHEMGTIDVPCIVDFVLLKTGYKTLAYIGISMGGTQYFVAASQPPVNGKSFNDKISIAVLYAPAVYMEGVKGPLGAAGKVGGRFASELGLVNGELSISNLKLLGVNVQQNILGPLCQQPLGQGICANILFSLMGFDLRNNNCSQIGFVISHLPNPTSIRCVLHYGQEIYSKKFAPWNPNLLLPGLLLPGLLLPGPQDYDLSYMKAKIAIFHGGQDYLADKADVLKIIAKLNSFSPSCIVNITYIADYMHTDFIFALNAKQLVFEPTLDLLKAYPPKLAS